MVKLFTHTDLDGIGCAVLAKLAFGKYVDICKGIFGNRTGRHNPNLYYRYSCQ